MYGRSLCLVKGWKTGLRRKYAPREGASAVAVACRCGVATVAAEGGMGGGGGTRCVFVREREELLAEGVRVKTGDFTPEATGEPCEAELPTALRG